MKQLSLHQKKWRIKHILLIIIIFLHIAIPSNAQKIKTPLEFTHYTTKDGLQSAYIKSIVQDSDGFIWVADRNDVLRFDGENFSKFPAYDASGKQTKLYCQKLFVTSDSILLGRTNLKEFYYFDSKTECFLPYKLLNDLNPIQEIATSSKGFWIKKSNKIFFLDPKNGYIENILHKLQIKQTPENANLYTVSVNNKWLVFNSENQLYCYNLENEELITHTFSSEENLIQYELLFLDSKQNIWLSSFYSGILKFNLKSKKCIHFSKSKNGNCHLPSNFIHSFSEDQLGRIWIGTEYGLAVYDNELEKMSIYNHQFSNPKGLNSDPIYDTYCDKHGNIWLGTYFGGINLWSNNKTFFQKWTPGLGEGQIKGDVVRCITEDNTGNLWIGLEDKGLNKYSRLTGKVTHFTDKYNNRLSYNNLHDIIFIDDTNELWIATYTGGINVLNVQTNKFHYFNRENTPELFVNDICMFEKYGDSIYIATYSGILIYSLKDKTFRKLKPNRINNIVVSSICKTKDALWFSALNLIYKYVPESDSLSIFDKFPELHGINFVKTDSKNKIWVGDCYDGLFCYNKEQDSLSHFYLENGFPANWIYSMEEGSDGWIWVGTDKGLVKFLPDSAKSIVYDNNSGIPIEQFNYNTSFTDSKANIYFGGNGGMISFNKDADPPKLQKLSIVFTGVKLFNKLLKPGDLKNFDQSINKLEKLILKHDQNIITLEFSALSYASNEKCKYSYYLDGFEKNWNEISNRNSVTYTNLNPGKYTFKVKVFKDDYIVEYGKRELQIIVLPPFWLTWWAYTIYFAIGVVLIFSIFRVGKNLEKSKFSAEFEHREKLHNEEIHKIKMNFFTNISHELKTPLMLILGPINKILEKQKISPVVRRDLNNVEQNAERLYTLTNQLLEFQKIENSKEMLRVSNCDPTLFFNEISSSFESLAESRSILFQTDFPKEGEKIWIDLDKIDKIIFNLLSNAFKFTHEGGKITLSIQLIKRFPSLNSCFDLLITVKDSGRGIHPEELDKIFERYYQAKENSNGSGIGLAYVKSLVTIHRGTINVDSIVNTGTSFTVKIPINKTDYTENEFNTAPDQFIPHKEIPILQINKRKSNSIDMDILSKKPHILIVEDNIELLDFLKEALEENFRITTAIHGVDALEKLEKITPELIVSDIMMPQMDGIQLTVQLKTNLKYSHIPIILLTSRSGTKNKLEGLQTGADFYIEKPFYPKLLEQNIKNILNTRKNVINKFKTENNVAIEEMTISEPDKIFLERIIAIIRKNISNPELDVMFLIKEMSISRTLLHTKLKNIVGCSSTEFIRSIRLKEAVKLISSKKCNISEAAYETGFSSPQYFSKRFREYFGKSPREYFDI
ncbi:hypothetical protein BZG01_04475 [Labilibaculum manganireducens]|uniref:histidine kinase n=1 Tax=Labilibaculum manganireducens TaxID=1940525 RepID=A0A2N3IDZ0_9BACT|nr:hybrid sensor histidine kinase/response regulator transcription factor [Labilibaculum manganireducens]PKQ68473.1 hypothetical protein BZG01_04475 [Labilibaculum manganireducens]